MLEEWISQAQTWAVHDPDPATRSLLLRQIEQRNEAGLKAGFSAPLGFGTAGLRGQVGPGPGRMNRALVAKLSWAVAHFLTERGLHERPLIIGYDGRQESRGFARVAAEVHRALGQEVWLLPRPGPTPWVAFAVRLFGAGAGVVLTPSHNPRGDGGYKLFDQSGIQIVSPWDTRIAELLSAAPAADEIPRAEGPAPSCPSELWSAYDAWLDELADVARGPAARSGFRAAYTPLHGIGFEAAARTASRQGVELVVVPEQKEPDGTFPSTPFPNPEEPGALDALLRLAREAGLDLGWANDPDADRFSVCCPRAGGSGEVSPLSGDQLGLLLADAWLEAIDIVEPLVVSTIVSSPGLDVLVRERGARLERTLTGFKWLGRPALDDPGFVFSYEEALGYCFALGERKPLLDKDGIAALTVLLAIVQRDMAATSLSPGACLAARLARLATRIGLWVSVGHNLRLPGDGAAEAASFMRRLREQTPSVLDGRAVLSVHDYSRGGEERPVHLGTQELLVFELEGAARICVRPSGTEAKLKFYVHVCRSLTSADDYALVEREATSEAARLGAALEAALSS